jgi:hypothetical protein
MAIQPLDLRLDKLNQQLVENDQLADIVSQPRVDPGIDATIPQTRPDAIDPDEKDIQVAGLVDVVGMVARKLKGVEIRKPPSAPVSPEAKAAAEAEDTAKAAIATGTTTSPTEAKIAGKVEASKKPGLTPEAFATQRKDVQDLRATTPPELEKPPLTAFNLPRMETTEDVKSTVETMNRMAGIKTENITFDDVRKAAENAGIGPKFIDQLTSGKLEVNPENTYKALNAMVASAKHLDALAAKVANGSATPTELAEMAQTLHFHSLLQQSVKGYQTNVAQSLAVMRMPRTGAADISEIMQTMGAETDLVRFAQAYQDLKTPEGKADLIRSMAQGNPWEKLFTVYVNGLLSRPGTQIKNALSNTIFLPLRMAERAGAAALGSVRSAIGLAGDTKYEFAEIPAMLASTPTAINNGWQLLSHAFVNGVPKGWTDPVKIGREQARRELFNYKADGSLLSTGLKAINYTATLPGRLLMSADEFFKGVNYTQELAAEAARLKINSYDEALATNAAYLKKHPNGKNLLDPEKFSQDKVDQFLLEPPDYIANLAEVGTFTQKLEGMAGKLQASMTPNTATGFALRTQMPFIGPPVNILGEVVSRTPLAPFTKTYWAAMKAGGKEADMANVKLGLSAAWMYSGSQMAVNGSITGSGPGDKGTRQAMERQGWQPYSIVFDVSNIKEDVRDVFSQFPGTRFGSGDYSGKVFVSYQGMEPVGALLSIPADYADYVRYEQDDSRVNAYVGGAVFGLANYMLEHPFLTGVSNIATLIGGNVPNTREHLVNMVNGIARIGTTVALKSVEPLSGFVTGVKENIDPYRRDYKADPNLPAGVKGVMDALNKWRSETPGLSEDLPPMLNIWAEPVEHEYAWAPLRTREGKMREVDQALIQLNANVSMPTRTVSRIGETLGKSIDTKLTTEEYNEVLRIANDKLGLESHVMAAIQNIKKDGIKPDDQVFYQDTINKVFRDVFSVAKKLLVEESIYSGDIKKRIEDKELRLKEFGRGVK